MDIEQGRFIMEQGEEVERFREYLRIKTVQPNPDYETCRTFLQNQAKEIGLDFQSYTTAPGKYVCILSWPGTDPQLSSIMLNSHTDVVPVVESKWTSPPFEARIKPNGDIVARGSQDMKCVGMWYLEAIRRLKKQSKRLLRTLHCVFVPDEEIGGSDGMLQFIQTPLFRSLNVAFVMDEGLACEKDAFKVYYGERAPWWIKFKAYGAVGHGSQFIQNTAASKLYKVIGKLMAFREAEESRLANGLREDGCTPLTLGDVTTVNWTMSSGGVQFNVIPDYMEAGFDLRLSPSVNMMKFKETLLQWATSCGCEVEFVQQCSTNAVIALTDNNPWWQAIKSASDTRGIKLECEIFPAATDSRYLREIGVPAIGVSPIKQTKVLLHDHDEYLNVRVYMEGIDWYTDVLERLGKVSIEPKDILTIQQH